jgi:hypothetical protein
LDPGADVAAATYIVRAGLDDELQPLLTDEINVRAFFDILLQKGRSAEALELMARVLPAKYSIAWASECLESDLALQREPNQADRVCLAAVKRWLGEPSEEHRRNAMEMAESLDYSTAGAWLAAAAAWSSGSVAPAELDPVPVPEGVAANAAAAALKLLAGRDKHAFEERLRSYLDLAVARFGTDNSSIGGGPG